MVRMVAVGLLCAAQLGCFGMMQRMRGVQPVKMESKALGRTGPAVDVASLQLAGPRDLPAGFLQANLAGGKVKLWAVPDWPTANDPHRVIAAYGWTGGAYGTVPDAVKTAAAKAGANTLVKLPNRNVAYGVYVSSAVAAEPTPAAGALLALEVGKHTDFKAVAKPVSVNGASFQPFAVSMKANHCYKVAVALDAKAKWSPAARAFLSASSKSNDVLAGNRSSGTASETFTTADGIELKTPYHGKLVRMRSFTVGLGCASGNSAAQLHLTGKGRALQIATGPVHLQLLQKSITPAETAVLLQKRKAALAKAAADAAAFEARERERIARNAQRAAVLEAQRQSSEKRRSRSRAAAPATRKYVSVSVHSECRQTVRIFKGKKPKWGSGTYGRHSANSIVSYSGYEGDMLWIVDASDNGVGAMTFSAGMRNMRILRSCSGFAPR